MHWNCRQVTAIYLSFKVPFNSFSISWRENLIVKNESAEYWLRLRSGLREGTVDTCNNSERTLVESLTTEGWKGRVCVDLEELLILRTAISIPRTVNIIWLKSGGNNIVYWVFMYSGTLLQNNFSNVYNQAKKKKRNRCF